MKVWAIRTNKPCKSCRQNHGFMTVKHKILVAKEDSKHILQGFYNKLIEKHSGYFELDQIDLDFIKKKKIGFIDAVDCLILERKFYGN